MQDLRVTLVQPNPVWHEIDENLKYISSLLSKKDLDTDVIILPEMFSTGFTMKSEKMAEPMNGRTHNWMQSQASLHDSVICGSTIIKENGNYYNRFLWVEPDGKTINYDKRHLFRMADENNHYSAGTSQVVIHYKGWKICPLVCYDLRFPIWARNFITDKEFSYDVLLYVANWPQARVLTWDTLLRARAMENYAYCIGVNRVGEDEKGIQYNGHSAVYDSKGDDHCFLDNSEQIYSLTLKKSHLESYREKFPSFLDADNFELKNN